MSREKYFLDIESENYNKKKKKGNNFRIEFYSQILFILLLFEWQNKLKKKQKRNIIRI